MTTGNISVFSQPMVKTDVSAAKGAGKDDINLTEADMFSEFMDRSASMQAPDINADKQETGAPTKNASPEESYNKMQSETHSNIKEKDDTASKTDARSPETVKAVSGKAEKIKEAIKEELNVTDEDIEKMMEILGLTDLDLFDQNLFVQLVTELSGAQSAVDLLSVEGMSDLLDDVALIKNELATELSISPEELSDVLKLMEEPAVDETFEIPADIQADLQTPVADAAEAVTGNDSQAVTENIVLQDTAASVEENVTADLKTEEVVEKVITKTENTVQNTSSDVTEKAAEHTSAPETEETPVRAEVKTEAQNTGSGDETDSFAGQDQTGFKKETTERFGDEAAREVVHNSADGTAHINVNAQNIQADSEVQRYIDVDSLIEQFATLTKEIENEQTTLSMRLNPENLGQLTLHVTEKQGNLTAEVRVENEQVRDALNTQIAELRANLENAGVKVTAVEVTVESHEFESAYENQAGSAAGGEDRRGDRPSEGAEETAEKITGIRNINLNNPDEIADNLTEAEIVNASIMRDNGNSVDFKA